MEQFNPNDIVLGVRILVSLAILVFWWVLPRRGGVRGSLVIRAFHLAPHPPTPTSPLVRVDGRPAGLISFLFTFIGLQWRYTFFATSQSIEFLASSVFGTRRVVVPVKHVAAIRGGTIRPLGYFVVAAILFINSFGMPAVVTLVFLALAALCVGWYFLKKKFFIEIVSEAGPEIGLYFGPSLLEAQMVDFTKVLAAVDILRDLISEGPAISPVTPAATPSTEAPVFPSPAASPPPFPPTPPTEQIAGAVFTGPPDTPPAPSPEEMEQAALKALREAVLTYNSGRREEGIQLLQDVVRLYPHTKAAQTAQGHLGRLGRSP